MWMHTVFVAFRCEQQQAAEEAARNGARGGAGRSTWENAQRPSLAVDTATSTATTTTAAAAEVDMTAGGPRVPAPAASPVTLYWSEQMDIALATQVTFPSPPYLAPYLAPSLAPI